MTRNAIWSGTCPHCGRDNTSFTSVAQSLTSRIPGSRSSVWNVFFECNACRGGLVAEVISDKDYGPHGLDENFLIPGAHYFQHEMVRFSVTVTHPSPPTHVAPDYVPSQVAAAYIEASENLHRHKNETSQMLSRKALDLATKRLLGECNKSLYGRIEQLRTDGKITSEMAQWAHIVRDDGNSSIHDETEVSAASAAELLAFTETFLMYAFTLPGMIASRRQADDSNGADANHSSDSAQ